MTRIKENEFTTKTKEFVGRSVLFRCCFPNCNRPLVYRKEKSDKLENCVEYAHIAAASPDGPRFDKSLSSEEIRSHENCIVMCGIHHKIIDDNPKEYSVSTLKEWKRIAEERTRNEVLSPKYNFNNGVELEALLLSLLKSGEYSALKTKINDFNDFNNINLNEVILRFKIYLKSMFNENSNSEIQQYINLGYDKIDALASFFIEYADLESLKMIVDKITRTEIKTVAQELMELDSSNIEKHNNLSTLLKKIDDTLFVKYIMNYTFRNTEIFCYIHDCNDKLLSFYEDEEYYKTISFVLKLREIMLITFDFANSDNIISQIAENIYTIDQFEYNIKISSYKWILMYLNDIKSELFSKYYNRLSLQEKNDKKIAELFYFRSMECNSALSIEEVLDFSNRVNDYKTLCIYLVRHPQEVKKFLLNHLYLLEKDSAFLLLYKSSVDVNSFVLKVNELVPIYKNDFLFNCIRWNIDLKNADLKKWCINHKNEITKFSIEIYISNLILSKENDEFLSIYKDLRDIDLKANFLLKFNYYNQDHRKYDKILIDYYEEINKVKLIKGINYNLAILYWNQGKENKAFKSLYIEIDNFPNENARGLLFHYRMEKCIWKKDKYFKSALSSVDYQSLTYVAEVYYNNNNINEALVYYEKALITGINNKGCSFKIFELTNNTDNKLHNKIEDNTVVKLSSFDKYITIAFHKKNVIEGINSGNTDFIDACLDYADYCDFYHHKIGDKLIYHGESYQVDNVEDLYSYFSKLAFADIISNPNSISFKDVDELVEFMKERNETIKNSNSKYLEYINILPLSISSEIFFNSKMFENLNALTKESNEKLINTIKTIDCDLLSKKIVLNIDSVFLLFSLKDLFFYDSSCFYITDVVKNRIINEINDELRDVELSYGSISMEQNEKMIYYGDEYNASKRSYFIKLKEFVESFQEIESNDFELCINNQKINTEKFKMDEEKSIISIANGNDNFIVVSDIMGFIKICELFKCQTIGLAQLLTTIVEPSKITEVALALKSLNFNNYFTYDMYLKTISNDESLFIDFLNKEFDTDAENAKHHYIMKAVAYELSRLGLIDSNRDKELLNFIYFKYLIYKRK